jgi:hypothetical protein
LELKTEIPVLKKLLEELNSRLDKVEESGKLKTGH